MVVANADNRAYPTDKFVRFCCICGEREDSPFLTRWCEDWSYTEQPRGTHAWGQPRRLYERKGVPNG